MHPSQSEWANETLDYTVLWVGIAGIVMSAYLAIAW